MRFEHHRGESGSMAESEFLGLVDHYKFQQHLIEERDKIITEAEKIEDENERRKFLNKLSDKIHEKGAIYLPYKKSLRVVREMQKMDPEKPKLFFPKLIRNKIIEKIKKEIPDKEFTVKYYTACTDYINYNNNEEYKNSSDAHHGVDAFFDFECEDKKYTVTLDFSIDPRKKDRADNADVIALADYSKIELKEGDEELDRLEKFVTEVIFCSLVSKIKLEEGR